MVADELKLLIRAETSKAVREMKKAQRGMERTHKSSQALVKNLLRQGAAWGSAVLSVQAVVSAVKSSVAAFREQEEATRALDAAVARNPLLDGAAGESLKAFSDSLSSVTTTSDQTIDSLVAQAAAAGKSEGEIKKIVSTAVDMASVLDMDVQQAFDNMLGTFTGTAGELEDFVPALGEMSEEALRSGDAVDVLNKQFDGMAEEMAQTSSGGLVQLQNAFTDLQEVMGGQILESMDGLIGRLTNFVERTVETREEIDRLNDALADDGGEANLESQVSTLEDMRDRARENLAAYEEQFGSLEDLNDIQKAAVADAQKQLETANSQLAVKRQLLAFERRAADGQAALAEHEQRRQERLEAFNEAAEYANELAEARKDPLEREIEALDKQIESLAEKRSIMRETGQWDQEYQQIINNLVAERAIKQEELNGKLNEEKETKESLLDTERIRQEATATFQEESKARLDDIKSKLEEEEAQAKQTAQTISDMYSGSVLPVFEEVGRAIVAQEDAWRGVGQVAIESVAGVLRALSQQAMAQAAAAIAQGILGDPRGFAAAAQWGVAAAAAQVGAGIVSEIASNVGSAATGADFETNGPQMLMVGDNPGGRERVTVEPTSSSIGGGSQPMGGDVYLDGRKVGEWIQSQTAKGQIRIAERAVV